MKSALKIVIFVLLVTSLACGKRNNHDGTTKAGGTTPTDDVARYKYVPADPHAVLKKDTYAMSDYFLVETIQAVQGKSDEKRIYAQMSLFFQPVNAADSAKDKTKKDQYNFFYSEFVTCKDGPTPPVSGHPALPSYFLPLSGEALHSKGMLNLGDLGQLRMGPKSKTSVTEAISFRQAINTRPYNTSPPILLNYKLNHYPLLSDYLGAKPVSDQATPLAKINCSNAGAQADSLVPFGDSPKATSTQTFFSNPANQNGNSTDDDFNK